MVTIREARLDDIKAIAKVHVDSWVTTYSGIVSAEYLNGLNYKDFESKWKSRSLKGVFVAEDEEGSVFGFASFVQFVQSRAAMTESCMPFTF